MKPLFSSRDLAITLAIAASILFLTIPLMNMIGLGSYKLQATLHGIAATLTMLFSCYVFHLLFPLLRGKEGASISLERMLWLLNALILATIVLGNWLYMGYRTPDGAQQWLIYHLPIGHYVFMEFKEIVSLFSLPMGVAAAVLLHRFRYRASSDAMLASLVAILVVLMCIVLLISFAFGIGLARLRMV